MAHDILLVDIGNSSLKWGWSSRNSLDIVETNQILHDQKIDSALLDRIWLNFNIPQRVIIANVAGEKNRLQVEQWVKIYWQIPVNFVTSELHNYGVTNAYTVPSTLGVDRWSAMIAAHYYCQGSILIVDCGTAITLDVLTETGQHMGGLITPGLKMMVQTLNKNTADINMNNSDVSMHFMGIAANTQDAILNGALHSAGALIEKVYQMSMNQLKSSMTLLLTGGDAQKIASILDINYQYEANLVLQGLAVINKSVEI